MGHSLNPLRVASQKLEMPTSITKVQIEIFINPCQFKHMFVTSNSFPECLFIIFNYKKLYLTKVFATVFETSTHDSLDDN